MRALSIKQPWADLIAYGYKNIENRTWQAPKDMIGQRFLIHAARGIDDHFNYDTDIPPTVGGLARFSLHDPAGVDPAP